MKHIVVYLLMAAGLAAGCSPQSLTMNVEMRYPSRSGLDLSRKTMAVVYVENQDAADSAFIELMVNSFAKKMEEEYFDGDEVIGLYRLPRSAGNYASKDTLVNLVMDTGEDVVFLFDVEDTVQIRLYVYDSMNPSDTVVVFRGRNQGWTAGVVGVQATARFLSQWKTEPYSLIYYETESWIEAAQKAYGYQWQEAIAQWMTFLGTRNLQKRACAEYNIALGCYMLGSFDLALKWLDRADEDQPLALSPGLRKRIMARRK